MKKNVALLLAVVTVVCGAGLFGLYSALGMSAKLKVKKEATVTDAAGMVSREYNIKNFEKLEVEGRFKVEFVQSSKVAMTVSAPEYEMAHLEVEVKGSYLEIEYDDAYYKNDQNRKNGKNRPMAVVKLSAPSLRSIEMSLSGSFLANSLKYSGELSIDVDTSASVDVKNVECDKLSLEADTSGSIVIGSAKTNMLNAEADTSGSVRVNGQTVNAVMKADTSGRVRSGNLTATNLTVDVDTSGSVEIESLAGENVIGRADTSGKIVIKGEAANVDFYADTSGSIKAGELKAERAKVGFDTGGKVVYCARTTTQKGSSLVNTYKED